MKFQRTALAIAVATACASAAAAPTITGYSFADRQVAPSEPLRIALDAPTQERLAVFIGQQDVSGVIRATSSGELVYPSDELALPPGDQWVTIYRLTPENTWADVARLPLHVAEPLAQAVATVVATPPSPVGPAPGTLSSAAPLGLVPKVDVSGQMGSQRVDSSGAAATTTTHTTGLQGGINYGGAVGDLKLNAQANIAGSSVRSQALAFARHGGDAEKVDLASYLVEGEYGATKVALGQVSFAANPLIANSLSYRGLTVSHKYGDRLDGSFTVQNGSSLLGADRLLGIYDTNHHFIAATVGAEMLTSKPRHLRVELTALQAEVTPALAGPDATPALEGERSKGIGMRVLAANDDERVKGDLVYSQSRYTPRPDALTGLASTSRASAYLFDGSWAAVREWVPRERAWPVSTTILLRHEYADPLYRSLGAGWGADYVQTMVAANNTWGPVTSQLSFTRREDNVDHVASILANRVSSANFTLSLPLATMLAPAKPNPWLPSAQVALMRVDQRGVRVPDTMPIELVPAIVTTTASTTLGWNFERVSVTAGVTRNNQDNRAAGSENRDLRTVSQVFSVVWRALDNFNFTAGYGPSRNFAGDLAITRSTRNPQLGFAWSGDDGWQITGNYNYDRSFDSADLASLRGYGFNTTVSKTISVPTFWGRPIPGQVALRHFITNTSSRTAAGAVVSEATQRTSGIFLSVSLNLF